MTVKMVVLWFSVVLFVVGSQAAGEFDVIHSPQSLKFSGSSRTSESLLKEIFSASLGLSVEQDAEWDGLSIVDPFATPEAVVEIYVDGISSLGNSAGLKKPHKFSLFVDEYEPDTFGALRYRIKRRFTDDANIIVKFSLSDPNEFANHVDVFGDILVPKVSKKTYEHLKPAGEDYQFLYEIEALKAIAARVRSGAISADNIIDFYYFQFRSLHALSDFHGPDSLQVKEAMKILGEAIQELSDAFVKAYDGSVLVSVVSTDVAHTRRVRAAPDTTEIRQQLTQSSNSYGEDYAAIFNIILWFGVVFVFALLSVVYALVDMDPGKDSIIYRMTSTRMKKDN